MAHVPRGGLLGYHKSDLPGVVLLDLHGVVGRAHHARAVDQLGMNVQGTSLDQVGGAEGVGDHHVEVGTVGYRLYVVYVQIVVGDQGVPLHALLDVHRCLDQAQGVTSLHA